MGVVYAPVPRVFVWVVSLLVLPRAARGFSWSALPRETGIASIPPRGPPGRPMSGKRLSPQYYSSVGSAAHQALRRGTTTPQAQHVLCPRGPARSTGAFVVPAPAAPRTSVAYYGHRTRFASTALRAAPVPGLETLFDPSTFSPVCVASDAIYRQTQNLVLFLVGSDTYQEYAPLIAGSLLRVRLELCVVESFVTEAIVPFVEQNGVGWILPRTETVETFLAGTIFAVALNVVFVGTSKILSVVVTFVDFFVGLPARLLANFPLLPKDDDGKVDPDKLALSKPVSTVVVTTLTLLGVFGQSLEVVRKVAEFADVFVARYLALVTVVYITVKFLHFRVLTFI